MDPNQVEDQDLIHWQYWRL